MPIRTTCHCKPTMPMQDSSLFNGKKQSRFTRISMTTCQSRLTIPKRASSLFGGRKLLFTMVLLAMFSQYCKAMDLIPLIKIELDQLVKSPTKVTESEQENAVLAALQKHQRQKNLSKIELQALIGKSYEDLVERLKDYDITPSILCVTDLQSKFREALNDHYNTLTRGQTSVARLVGVTAEVLREHTTYSLLEYEQRTKEVRDNWTMLKCVLIEYVVGKSVLTWKDRPLQTAGEFYPNEHIAARILIKVMEDIRSQIGDMNRDNWLGDILENGKDDHVEIQIPSQ